MVNMKTIIPFIFCAFVIVSLAAPLTDEEVDKQNHARKLIYQVFNVNKTFVPLLYTTTTTTTTTTRNPRYRIRTKKKIRYFIERFPNGTAVPQPTEPTTLPPYPYSLTYTRRNWEMSRMLGQIYNATGCPDMETFYATFRKVIGDVDGKWQLELHLEEIKDKVNQSSHPQAQCMASFFEDLEVALLLIERKDSSSELEDSTEYEEEPVNPPVMEKIDYEKVNSPWIRATYKVLNENRFTPYEPYVPPKELTTMMPHPHISNVTSTTTTEMPHNSTAWNTLTANTSNNRVNTSIPPYFYHILDRRSRLLWDENRKLARDYNISFCPRMHKLYPFFRSVIGDVDDAWDLHSHIEDIADRIRKTSHPQAKCLAKYFEDLGDAHVMFNDKHRKDEESSFHDATKFQEEAVNAPILHPIEYRVYNQPTLTQPTLTQPTSTQPTLTQPTSTQPTLTQPTSTQPTLTQPTSTQPTLIKKTLSEFTQKLRKMFAENGIYVKEN